MKKSIKLLFTIMLVAGCLFTVTSCFGNGNKEKVLTVCVGPNPDTIDPALNSAADGATYIIHAFSGLVGYNAQGKLVAACAKELPQPTELPDGKVQYVFELKDDLKWSDGSALTAADFEYSWKRAMSKELGADYEYMFDVIDGYAEGNLNVTASSDGKSLTVVLPVDVPYFYELCAFPTYMPVKKSVVEADPEGWATKAETYVGNGAYKLTEFTMDSKLVFVKNENYFDASSVKVDKIEFALSDDDTAILANFKNGTYKFIDSVPNDEISKLKEEYPNEFNIGGQLGTYYVCFNVNDPNYASFSYADQVKIRKALSLYIDRNYVCEEIGQAGQQPASGFVAKGLVEPDGKEWISKNGLNRDGKGYYSVEKDAYQANCAEATKLLKEVAEGYASVSYDEGTKKFTGFPTLKYITNPGTGHEAIAQYLQQVWGSYGFNMTIDVEEWNTFLNTRKEGNYSVARNGWLGDYNDPISFLDMWTTGSGNNDVQFGREAHQTVADFAYKGEEGKTWAESYDKLIAEVKSSKDPATRFTLMHAAEDLLMQTGCITPIYYYTDIYMVDDSLDGFYASPLGYKYFMFIK